MKSVTIIIPAFNEENGIGEVIREIPKDFVTEIVVVNNASTDQTEKIALEAGATVLREPVAGYGRACLKGIVDQLDISFSQGHPMVLGRHIKVADLLKGNAMKWKQTFAIEMGYRIENRKINCDLLLLFTEDSMDAMRR